MNSLIIPVIWILLLLFITSYDKLIKLPKKYNKPRTIFSDKHNSLGHFLQGFIGGFLLSYLWTGDCNKVFIYGVCLVFLLIYPIYDYGKNYVKSLNNDNSEPNTLNRLKSTNFYVSLDEFILGIFVGFLIHLLVKNK